jgi:hypothetical protein
VSLCENLIKIHDKKRDYIVQSFCTIGDKMLNRERGKNLLNGMMLIFAGFVIFVTSQSLPTFGKDYQVTG